MGLKCYRVVVEVEMGDGASADDALSWANRVLRAARLYWSEGRNLEDSRMCRVVSAMPVREAE